MTTGRINQVTILCAAHGWLALTPPLRRADSERWYGNRSGTRARLTTMLREQDRAATGFPLPFY